MRRRRALFCQSVYGQGYGVVGPAPITFALGRRETVLAPRSRTLRLRRLTLAKQGHRVHPLTLSARASVAVAAQASDRAAPPAIQPHDCRAPRRSRHDTTTPAPCAGRFRGLRPCPETVVDPGRRCRLRSAACGWTQLRAGGRRPSTAVSEARHRGGRNGAVPAGAGQTGPGRCAGALRQSRDRDD